MILSRLFQGIEPDSVPTQITDHLLTLYKEKSFSKTTFFCERLRLEKNVQFTECEFPNLRLLELAFIPNGPYRPFDSCTFDFPLNLVCETSITIEIPATIQILSIETVEVPVELIQNGKTTTVDRTGWIVTEDSWTVQVKYGTETSSLLDQYSLWFYIKEVEFEEDPKVIMEPMTLIISSSGRRLGQIKVEIMDHPFSLAVLESDGLFINFNESIPDYWARDAHPSALERLKKIRGLSVLGRIGTEGLADLELDLEFLEVGGEIGPYAFNRTVGWIKQLTVESLIEDSFRGSRVIFDSVHLNTVEPGVKIEADIISIASSSQSHVVEYAKTLIIREKFDLPIDASEMGLSKVDFRTVTNPGPFIIRNFDHKVLTVLQPDQLG